VRQRADIIQILSYVQTAIKETVSAAQLQSRQDNELLLLLHGGDAVAQLDAGQTPSSTTVTSCMSTGLASNSISIIKHTSEEPM